jgi:CheY-like chemotaxis protein
MGGEIGVESEAGVGSTFTFTVALGVSSAAELKTFDTTPELKNMHVMVVDDNPTAREILTIYLEHFTFNVDQATRAEEVFQLMEETAKYILNKENNFRSLSGNDIDDKALEQLRSKLRQDGKIPTEEKNNVVNEKQDTKTQKKSLFGKLLKK